MSAPDTSRILTVRIPSRLEDQLKLIARRDANSVSAALRRLLMIGLRMERRDTGEAA